jgi:hypothetical protein
VSFSPFPSVGVLNALLQRILLGPTSTVYSASASYPAVHHPTPLARHPTPSAPSYTHSTPYSPRILHQQCIIILLQRFLLQHRTPTPTVHILFKQCTYSHNRKIVLFLGIAFASLGSGEYLHSRYSCRFSFKPGRHIVDLYSTVLDVSLSVVLLRWFSSEGFS